MGVLERMTAFEAVGPGSIPGRATQRFGAGARSTFGCRPKSIQANTPPASSIQLPNELSPRRDGICLVAFGWG